MPAFSPTLLECLATRSRIGVKGGTKRDKFLPIWMVVIDGRVFARSWDLNERSWFTAFVEEGVGEIQCGKLTARVVGKVLPVEDDMQERINRAYLEKYNRDYDLPYATGIAEPERVKRTMEFLSV